MAQNPEEQLTHYDTEVESPKTSAEVLKAVGKVKDLRVLHHNPSGIAVEWKNGETFIIESETREKETKVTISRPEGARQKTYREIHYAVLCILMDEEWWRQETRLSRVS